VWLRPRSGSTPRKNDRSAWVLTVAAAAGEIRAPVNNRVDNQLTDTTVANQCRRRLARARPCYCLTRVAALTVAPPQPHRHRAIAEADSSDAHL